MAQAPKQAPPRLAQHLCPGFRRSMLLYGDIRPRSIQSGVCLPSSSLYQTRNTISGNALSLREISSPLRCRCLAEWSHNSAATCHVNPPTPQNHQLIRSSADQPGTFTKYKYHLCDCSPQHGFFG